MEPAALSLTDLLHPDLGDWSDSEADEMEDTDELLLLASQLYESMSNQPQAAVLSSAAIQGTFVEHVDHAESNIDSSLLAALQQYESALPTPATPSASAAPALNDLDQIFLAADSELPQRLVCSMRELMNS